MMSWRREKIGNRNVFVFDEAFLCDITEPAQPQSCVQKLLSFFWFLSFTVWHPLKHYVIVRPLAPETLENGGFNPHFYLVFLSAKKDAL